jgi:hypothetical protein
MFTQLKDVKWHELVVIFLLATICYALHFQQYFPSFTTDVFFFNDPDDAKVYYWNTWHFAHQLKSGGSVFSTEYIFAPEGSSLWMHAYTVWFGVLHLGLNNIALAINLGIAIQLVLAFIGFYFLAKRVVHRPYLAVFEAYISVFTATYWPKLAYTLILYLLEFCLFCFCI